MSTAGMEAKGAFNYGETPRLSNHPAAYVRTELVRAYLVKQHNLDGAREVDDQLGLQQAPTDEAHTATVVEHEEAAELEHTAAPGEAAETRLRKIDSARQVFRRMMPRTYSDG